MKTRYRVYNTRSEIRIYFRKTFSSRRAATIFAEQQNLSYGAHLYAVEAPHPERREAYYEENGYPNMGSATHHL